MTDDWQRGTDEGDTLVRERPAVDPRIQQRRDEVSADRRRRLWSRVGFVALIAVVLAAGWFITQTALLDVDDIQVRGARQLTPEAVADVSGIALGDPLTGLDLAAAADEVAALAWVESAAVSRQSSGVVRIDIVERTLAAVFITEDDAVLVDRDGRVLDLWLPGEGERVRDVVPIHGVEITAEPGQWIDARARNVVTTSLALPPEVTGAAYRMEMGAHGLDLYLGSMAGRVTLGDEREMEAKVWAIRSFADSVDLRCMDTLDLRAPSVPVLTFLPNCP